MYQSTITQTQYISKFSSKFIRDSETGDGLGLKTSHQSAAQKFPTNDDETLNEEDPEDEEDYEYPEQDNLVYDDTTSPTTRNRNPNINTNNNGKTFSQNSPTQKQAVAIANPQDKYKVVQTQNGKTVVHTASSTEKVPDGFNSIRNNNDVIASPAIVPSMPTKKVINTKYLPSKYIETNKILNENTKIHNPDYVTVTKSITGSIDDSKTPPVETKNFESTYYTSSSSTCGYFTFSCNIVYGSNGRSKICRPKPPTNGKC